MRKIIFEKIGHIVAGHSGKLLLISLLLTIVMVVAAGRLKMKTQISDMLPGGIEQVEEFEKVMDEFSSTASIMITISDESGKSMEEIKKVANILSEEVKPLKYIAPPLSITGAQRFSHGLSKMGVTKDTPLLGMLIKDVPLDTINLVDRVDLTMDDEFIDNHGFMMQTTKDLNNTLDMFGSLALPTLFENINNSLEAEFIEDSENIASLDGEARAVSGIEGMYKLVESLENYIETPDSTIALDAIAEFVSGGTYIISPDNTTLLFQIQPTVTMNDFDAAMNLTGQIKKIITAYGEKYENLNFGYSGMLMLQQDETDALATDFGWPSLVALLLIVILLAGSFKTWKTPFLSVVTLVVAIIWVAGALGIILEFLNMMSASFGIILIGLGIDFGIHSISGFRDGREQGMGVEESIKYMYDRTATGVLTGGLTTAIVFYSLALTGFSAFTEMGIAVGTGIIVTMLAMMIILPALIAFTTSDTGDSPVEKIIRKSQGGFLINVYRFFKKWIVAIADLPIFAPVFTFLEFRFIGKAVHFVQNPVTAAIILIISLGWAGVSYSLSKKIGFEYDMMKLEPAGITSAVTQDSIISKFEMSPDYALVLARSLEEGRELVKKIKKAGDRFGNIGRVDGVSEIIPSDIEQSRNIETLKDYRLMLDTLTVPDSFTIESRDKLADELVRLHQNFVEMADMSILDGGESSKIVKKCDKITGKISDDGNFNDSKILAIAAKVRALDNPQKLSGYQTIAGATLKDKLGKMSTPEVVTAEMLPESISERYFNEDGDNLITIYPKENIWNENSIKKFNKTMEERVSPKVTGTPVIMAIYMKMMKEKGALAILFGSIAIFIFLLIDFRSIKDTILAVIPLAIGTLWMVGFMYILGIKFNMVNFMALPLIIGIGIDDGVHILHRYHLEGKMKLEEVMRYTGRAILLTSLTTSIGFGSMALASHRGIASMGIVLVLGVISCFLTSSFVLTSLITLDNHFFGKKIKKDVKND
jgi:predicted RND superfamily exporter protein